MPGKTHEHVLHAFTRDITGSPKSSVDYKRGEFGPTLYQLKPLEPIKVDDAFVEYPATIDQIAILLKTLDRRSARHGVGEIDNISKILGRLSQIVLWLDGNNSAQDKLEQAQIEYLKKLAAYKAGREVLRLV